MEKNRILNHQWC